MTLLDQTHAIVVNWNGGEANLVCVQSLLDGGLPEARIQFVDNGSTDGSLESVTARFPGLAIQCNETNEGFARGANRGARAAIEQGAEAVFFVNNDVRMDAPTLAHLTAVLEAHPEWGAIGPRVLFAGDRDRIWSAGGVLALGPNQTQLLGHGLLDGARYQHTLEVDYVPGCALLMTRESIESVGLFDEGYFAYMEDVDLGLRLARVQRASLCVGEVACEHTPSSATGGGYSPRRKYLNGFNSLRFLRSHPTAGRWLAFLCFDVLALPLVALAAAPRGRLRGALAKGLGIAHGLLGRKLNPRYLEKGASWLW